MSAAKRFLAVAGLVLGLIFAPWTGQAWATLNLFNAFQDAALSIDGACAGGCDATQNALQTNVPNGSTVAAAFLYVADIFGNNPTPNGSVTLAGNTLALSSFTKLAPNANPANTYRLNVTSIMKPIIEGTGGLQTHSYSEAQTNMDGAVLVVAYRNAATVGGTAIILDGELAQAGDSTTLGFASPYTSGPVIMSLASSFSFQASNQSTLVDITTSSNASARRLTSCAGGQDDGAPFDGGLITVGGIGDSTGNPDPACTSFDGNSPRQDDELYDLGQGNSANANAFLSSGDTSITLLTSNPSFDDNVFFLGFTSSIRVTEVDDTTIPTDDGPTDDTPTTPTVPTPATLLLIGAGLLGTALVNRKRR